MSDSKLPEKVEAKSVDLKELDKKIMFEEFVQGMTLREVAEKHGIAYRTILRYSGDGEWSKLKEQRLIEMRELDKVDNRDVIAIEATDKAIRALHKLASDLERDLYTGKDPTVNHKALVDSLDKAIKLKMHMASGGVSKSEVSVKKQTLDWNALIEFSVKTRKEHGDDFDEKKFFETVINTTLSDKK